MSAKSSPTRSINLLPGANIDASQTGKFIKWLLSTFRVIVIFVQIVVIGAFAVRIFVDTQLYSLNKEIEGKYAILNSFAEVEKDFLSKQLRLQTFQSLQVPENSYMTVLQTISQNVPLDVQLISLNKVGSLLTIKARTLNDNSIFAFNSRLSQSELINNVQVTEIIDNLIDPTEFTISASVPTLAETTTQ